MAAFGVPVFSAVLAVHNVDADEAGLLEDERLKEAGYRLRVGELLRAAERISSAQLD